MNILLTGASGFVGLHISGRLQEAGHYVKAATRNNGFDYNQMTRKEDWLPHLKAIDVVINAVGIITEINNQSFQTLHHHAPAALFQACLAFKHIRVVQISALGADDELRSLALDWFVLRPSLIYGKGGTSMEMFKRLASLPVLPLVGGGKQRIQPVYINDLTDTVLTCLTSSKVNVTLDMVGAKSLLLKDWLQFMRTSENKQPAIIISIPFNIALVIAKCLKFMLPLLHPDNLQMLQKGNYADVTPLKKFLGRLPLDVETGWKQI